MLRMRFIAFEGLDGAGKSTLIQGLAGELKRLGQECVVTREPGGSRLGSELRELLLRVDGEAPVARAEALLYQADRAQHVETVIRPALAKKQWVLSDRFAASSIAFQVGGRNITRAEIDWLNAFSTAGLKPDLYVLLDLSVEESLKRLAGRPAEADRFEREQKSFHERVRASYLEQSKAGGDGWLTLDASRKPADLMNDLFSELRRRRWLA